MRVLLVSHVFFPDHRAGVETYTLQLAQNLAREHEVLVATTEKIISLRTGTLRRREVEGVKVAEVVNNLDHERWPESWSRPEMTSAFGRILEEFRPDVVHAQHLMYWSHDIVRMTRDRGVPFLLTLHDYHLGCGRMGQLIDADGALCAGPSAERCAPCLGRSTWNQSEAARRWIGRLAAIRRATGVPLDGPLRRLEAWRSQWSGSDAEREQISEADRDLWATRFAEREEAFRALTASVSRFITPSRTLRRFMVDWGVPADQILHVRQGLDAAPFSSARPKDPGRPLRVGFLGTIAPHKGVHVLLEAAARLPEGALTLDVYGPAGQHAAYARELAERFGAHPAIRLHGALSRDEVPATLAGFDVLCVPSLWNECCPLTIQEAYLSHVPCLVSDLGGMAELAEGHEGGRALPAGDVDAWEAALRELTEDPGTVERMTAAVPVIPSLAEHVAGLVALYRAEMAPSPAR